MRKPAPLAIDSFLPCMQNAVHRKQPLRERQLTDTQCVTTCRDDVELTGEAA